LPKTNNKMIQKGLDFRCQRESCCVGLGRSRRSRDGVRRHIETTELPGAAAGRGLIERHVDRVIVRPQAVEVRLKSSRMTEPAEAASDASMVPIGMIDRINATT
jgi:hypothetical protein